MFSELAKQARTHLEFLGYRISPDEENEVLRVTRPGRFPCLLSANEEILRLFAYLTLKEVEPPGCLQFINSLNVTSVLVCFFKNDSSLVCQGAFYGVYSKASFALFVEAWEHDTMTTLHERSKELLTYIEG